MTAFVQMLGRPSIDTQAGRLGLDLDRVSGLLFYLAFKQDWVSRDELLYVFWPDVEERRARANLRQVLVRIRKLVLLTFHRNQMRVEAK